MTLTQLKYIVAVDTYRHFAIAADHCFVTQPTLSMQISKMEKVLDVLIFDRSKHPVEPTEIGKRIIAQARTVLQEASRIEEMVRGGKAVLEGDFRLGIIPTVSTNLLPRFLRAFTDKYPQIKLKVEELPTAQIINKLDRDELDAGLMATPLDDARLLEMSIYREPFMAFIPEGHRLAEGTFVLHSELQLDDMLLLRNGHCFREHVINLCGATRVAKAKGDSFEFESGNFETLIRLSLQGFGMTLLPYLTALDLPEDQKRFLKPLEHPQPTREISLVYNRAQLKLGIIELLHSEIKKRLPKKILENPEQLTVSPLSNQTLSRA